MSENNGCLEVSLDVLERLYGINAMGDFYEKKKEENAHKGVQRTRKLYEALKGDSAQEWIEEAEWAWRNSLVAYNRDMRKFESGQLPEPPSRLRRSESDRRGPADTFKVPTALYGLWVEAVKAKKDWAAAEMSVAYSLMSKLKIIERDPSLELEVEQQK